MKKYFAELIGTFALVFCCTGAAIINEVSGDTITHVGIAITCGLIVACMIYAVGDISGSHLNPVVTFGFWLAKEFPTKDLLPYMLSQTAGAFMASAILKFLFPASSTLGETLPSGTAMQSFIIEIIITFILMFVILRVATGSKEQGMFAGLAIGFAVLLAAMFAGPISGASMNPARSLAPAVLSGHLHHIWIYLTAPVLGASIAVVVWKLLKEKN